MYWYAIYRYPEKFRQGTLPGTGIYGPYSSEEKAYLKLAEVEELVPGATPWDVYETFTDNPRNALDGFLSERKFAYAGGTVVREEGD